MKNRRTAFDTSLQFGWSYFSRQIAAASGQLDLWVIIVERYGAYILEILENDPKQAVAPISLSDVTLRLIRWAPKLVAAHENPGEKAAEAAERAVVRDAVAAVRKGVLEKRRKDKLTGALPVEDIYADPRALGRFDNVDADRLAEEQARQDLLNTALQPIMAEFVAKLTKRDLAILTLMLDLDAKAYLTGEKTDLDEAIAKTLGVSQGYVAVRRTHIRKAFESVLPEPIVTYIKKGETPREDSPYQETTQAARYLECLRAFLTATGF